MGEKVYGICGTNKCRKEVIPKENLLVLTGHIDGVAKGEIKQVYIDNVGVDLNDYVVIGAEQSTAAQAQYKSNTQPLNVDSDSREFYPVIIKRHNWVQIKVINNVSQSTALDGSVDIYYRVILLKVK